MERRSFHMLKNIKPDEVHAGGVSFRRSEKKERAAGLRLTALVLLGEWSKLIYDFGGISSARYSLTLAGVFTRKRRASPGFLDFTIAFKSAEDLMGLLSTLMIRSPC